MSRRNQSIITEMVDDADQEVWRKPSSSDDPVLALVKDGRVDAEIAVRLGISNAEVKERIERLVAKHGVRNRAELREPPKPAAVEELVPIEVETVAADRVSPVRAALWAGAVALVVGLGAGWWIRDEQANSVKTMSDETDSFGPPALEILPAFRPVEIRASELAELFASTPRPATEIGPIFFGTDGKTQTIDTVGRDELNHRIVTLNGPSKLGFLAIEPWTIARRTTGEAELTAKVKGTYLTLRLETANDTTRIDRDGDIIRISSTDGSNPRVKLWIEGSRWEFGADGRLVVYL